MTSDTLSTPAQHSANTLSTPCREAHSADTVPRPCRHKKKKKKTEEEDLRTKNIRKTITKSGKQRKTAAPALASMPSGLGMKGSKLLTRQRAWQLKHPERRAAHEAVRRALLRGELVRQPCEDCGAIHTVDAHHEDYSRPLEVTWLCRRHHMARHRRKIVTGPKG